MILSHRGYWLKEDEKNTVDAFERSFSLGFGTETDIRDWNGQLVISHDMANEDCISLEQFFQIFVSFDRSLPLALNIKADGLQNQLLFLLQKYEIENYFVFDMSIPDALGYLKKNIKAYTRQSEYEKTPSFYESAQGVWMDEFLDHWITKEQIQGHVNNGKAVCIVSPELHRREYLEEWKLYREFFDLVNHNQVSICTDRPEEAKNFFRWEK